MRELKTQMRELKTQMRENIDMAKTKETEKLEEMAAKNHQTIDFVAANKAAAAARDAEQQAVMGAMGLNAQPVEPVEPVEPAPTTAAEVVNDMAARREQEAVAAAQAKEAAETAAAQEAVRTWREAHPEAYNPYSDTWLPEGTDEKTLANMRRAHETDKLIAERYGMDGLRYTGDALIGDIGSENWRNYNKMLGGANALRAGLYNQDLVGNSIERYRKQQQEARDAELAAARGAVDERNKADDVYTASNGTEYTIPKTFSDRAKQWLPYYTAAQGRIDAANAVLNNPNATAAQKKQAQAVLTAANNSMTKLVGQMNGYMEEAGLLGKSEVAPTTMDELQARWDADGDATMGSVAMEEVLSRALEREDEVYQEPQKSFEDIMEERRALDARQAEIDRDAEDRRIARQRLFTGIGDLSKIVGDMIKASDGALVTKSDVQQYYDNLTAQQKANYDNYRIRMQKLKDEAKADQIRQQQQAFAIAQANAARQADLDKLKYKEQAADQRAAEANQVKLQIADWKNKNAKDVANIAAKARVDAANIAAAARKAAAETAKAQKFEYNGKMYTLAGGESFDACMNDIKAILQRKESWKQNRQTISYKPDKAGSQPQSYYNERVTNILQSNRGDLANGVNDAIEAYLNAYSVSQPTDSGVSTKKKISGF